MLTKRRLVLAGACLGGVVAVASPAVAIDLVRLEVNGVLGDGPLSLHAPYDNQPFAGFIELDLDAPFSTGDNTGYLLTDWDITVQSNGSGPVLRQLADGETHDAGQVVMVRSSDRLSLRIDEDIDNPSSGAIEDRTLSLIFDSTLDITSATVFEDLLAEPGFGELPSFNAPSSLLQLSTSQAPIPVTQATLLVPEPGSLATLGLCSLLALRRRCS